MATVLVPDAWQFRWIEDLAGDLRYGFRTFRRSPGFALTAVVSLALGIGANAAIFNALYTLLWKPLPVSKPEELVSIRLSSNSGLRDVPTVGFVRQLRSAGVFEGVSVTSADGLSFSYDDRAERVQGEVVSGNYFDVLGVRPIIGQPFTSEVRSGHWAAEVVLSYGFWQRRFGGDPGVIGRTIRLNTYPFTVAGVSPRGFHGLGRGTDIEVRIPILPDGRELAQIERIGARPDRNLITFARLKPDSSLAQAEVSADVQFKEYLRTTTNPRFRDRGIQHVKLVAVGKGDSGVLRQLHTPLYILFVLVALVLLIACANVANMLLARAAARARELAVRTSIGAGRFRLIRQMLAESLLLSLFAGALAVVIGNWVADALVHFLPQGTFVTVVDLRMDAVTVLFVLALSLVACVTFGLAPAIRTTRCNLAGMLKTDSGASIGDLSSGWFRRLLVVSQVAFSLVLLIAAGIFVRTMLNLWPTDYGAHPERVLLFTMKPQREIYTPVQRRALIAELVRRVSEIPGVEAAGVAEYGRSASVSANRRRRLRRNLGIRSAPKPIGSRRGSSMLLVYRTSPGGILHCPTGSARRSSYSSISRWPTSFSETQIRLAAASGSRKIRMLVHSKLSVWSATRGTTRSMAHRNPQSGSPSRTMQRRTCPLCTSAAAA
jgi:predicted permease